MQSSDSEQESAENSNANANRDRDYEDLRGALTEVLKGLTHLSNVTDRIAQDTNDTRNEARQLQSDNQTGDQELRSDTVDLLQATVDRERNVEESRQ